MKQTNWLAIVVVAICTFIVTVVVYLFTSYSVP